jgi:hypothetical protein
MFRIDSPGATVSGRFKETPLPATRVSADWLNATQDEVVAVIEQLGGLTLDKENSGQMAAAIAAFADAGDVDTLAAANAAIAPTKAKLERVITDAAGGAEVVNPASAAQLLQAIQRMIGLGIASAFELTTEGADLTTQRTLNIAGIVRLKMGYFRETLTSEVTRSVAFTTPFPNGCWHVWTQDVIAAPSIYRDLWSQVIPGNTSVNGFTVQFQSDDDNDHALSGFDWFAFGN